MFTELFHIYNIDLSYCWLYSIAWYTVYKYNYHEKIITTELSGSITIFTRNRLPSSIPVLPRPGNGNRTPGIAGLLVPNQWLRAQNRPEAELYPGEASRQEADAAKPGAGEIGGEDKHWMAFAKETPDPQVSISYFLLPFSLFFIFLIIFSLPPPPPKWGENGVMNEVKWRNRLH